jgi:hypothetical protein
MPTRTFTTLFTVLLCFYAFCSELALQEDEVPVWEGSTHSDGSRMRRSPLLQSMMRPPNDGIGVASSPNSTRENVTQVLLSDDVTGFLGSASIASTAPDSSLHRRVVQPPLGNKSDGRLVTHQTSVVSVVQFDYAIGGLVFCR